MRPRSFIVAAVLTITTATVAASAQPSSSDLKALYEQGRTAISAGDWQGAYDALSQVWARQKSGRVAGLLGQAEIQLGNCADAIDHLKFALGDLPPDRPHDAVAHLNDGIAECKSKVATIHLDVEPESATVLLNGKPLGSAKDVGKEVFADPGKIQVLLTQDGYRAARFALEVAPGQSGDVKVALEPEKTQESGSVTPSGSAETHLTPPAGPAGESSGGKRNWVPAYVLGGVTVLSGVATLWLHSAASSDADKVKSLQSSIAEGQCTSSTAVAGCGSLRSTIERHDREADWANVTLVTTGVAAAATIGYITYEFVSSPSSSTTVRASLGFGSSGGSLFLNGAF